MWPWKRRTFIWSPWMSPAEIDAANGLEPLAEGPFVAPPTRNVEGPMDALLAGIQDDHDLGQHDGETHWLCAACKVRDRPVLDPGEGLLC